MNTETKGGVLRRITEAPIEITAPDGHVSLRQFSLEDSEEMFALIDSSRDHLSQFGDETAAKYPTLASFQDSITNPSNPQRLRFGIRNRAGQLVGSINLTPEKLDPTTGEIGYYLGKYETGNGYAVAAVRALSDYAFTKRGYETLYGVVAAGNKDSVKVLENAGFEADERVSNEFETYLFKLKHR